MNETATENTEISATKSSFAVQNRTAGPAAGLVAWVRSRPATTVLVVVLVVMGVVSVRRHSTEWDEVYVGSARALLNGQDLYNHHVVEGFTYPPFPALVSVPFAMLPPRLARGIWFTICAASLVYLMKSSWRLAGGLPLEPGTDHQSPVDRRELVAALIGQAIALQFALNVLTHLQPDLLIAAMLMGGCAAIASKRFIRAATWIGVAAAFKATPLLFAPYFLYRKQWRAAGWMLCVTVGASLLPNLIHGPPGGGLWLTRWYAQYLKPMADEKFRPGDWKNLPNNNQSLAGAVKRWMATSWSVENGEFEVIDRPVQPNAELMKWAFAGSCLVTLVPIGWAVAVRRRRRVREAAALRNPRSADGKTDDASAAYQLPSAAMIECGIVFLIMVLFSPNSSRAHFCVMYLAAFCVARLAVRPGATVTMQVFLALAVLFSTLSIHIRLPGTQVPEQLLLWVGVVMISALFLLLASAIALARAEK